MDDQITCGDCGGTFVFTEAERVFYEARGLAVPPKRCKACRQARKQGRGDGPGSADRPREAGGWSRPGGARGPRSGDRPWPGGDRGARTGDRPRSGAGRAGPARFREGGARAHEPAPVPRRWGPPRDGKAPRPPSDTKTEGPAEPKPKVRPERPKYDIECATCGARAQVPFKPLEGREVFCQPCYRARPRPAHAGDGAAAASSDREPGIE
jgi:CxxC-x17-CxxC domain-containing protein